MSAKILIIDDDQDILETTGSLLEYEGFEIHSADSVERGMEMIAEIASEILPACIDRDPADIPFQCAPEVIDLVLDQNFTGDAVKKWSALAQKIPGLASVIVKEDGKGSASDIPSQSKTSKE